MLVVREDREEKNKLKKREVKLEGVKSQMQNAIRAL